MSKQPYTFQLPEQFLEDSSVPLKWKVFAIINSFWLNGRTCFATNEWFMERLKAPERTIKNSLTELERDGLILRRVEGYDRTIFPGLGQEKGNPVAPRKATPLHHTITVLKDNKEISKEISSSKDITEAGADTDGDSLGTNVSKKPRDSRAWRILQYFIKKCEKEIGHKILYSAAGAKMISRALQRIDEKECLQKVDEWFEQNKPDSVLMSIPACFSDDQINKFITQ